MLPGQRVKVDGSSLKGFLPAGQGEAMGCGYVPVR